MSNRDRNDREYEERQYAQGNRQQGSRFDESDASPRGQEGRDRDIQNNFSSSRYNAGYGQQSHAGSQGNFRGSQDYGTRGSQGYPGSRYEGLQSYGSSADHYGPGEFSAPSSGAGSQGFGPEGYGTPRYSGQWQGSEYGSPEYRASQAGFPQGNYPQGNYAQGSGSRESQLYGQNRFSEQGRERYGAGLQGGASGAPWRESHLGQQGVGQHYQGYRPGSGQQDYGRDIGEGRGFDQSRFGSEQSRLSGYRGLGPKNYTRSDERIREDLHERLTDAHDIDATGIEVQVRNGEVTLTGTVHERWMKHRAEDLAENCSGVRDVHNQIRVQSQSQQQGLSGTHSTSGSQGLGSGSATSGSTGASSLGASTSGTSGSAGSGSASGSSGSSTPTAGNTGASGSSSSTRGSTHS